MIIVNEGLADGFCIVRLIGLTPNDKDENTYTPM